ncbi:MAG TPA: hypothetical protein VK745_14005 [Polyangiaceae bacterium]|jgi:hypothetical protein|nr:hypothetical protein [Polyangiaceae bacterium]
MRQLHFFNRVYSSLATARARGARSSTLLALCLVALQLVTALHFALVPHSFSAGLNGFVHVHGARAQASQADSRLELTRRASAAPALVASGASCSSESCPIGFAGQHALLLADSGPVSLLAFGLDRHSLRNPSAKYFAARNRVLLGAPKTSPPV